MNFRLEGSKDCVKREKAIKVAQLLIKSHLGEVKGRFSEDQAKASFSNSENLVKAKVIVRAPQ